MPERRAAPLPHHHRRLRNHRAPVFNVRIVTTASTADYRPFSERPVLQGLCVFLGAVLVVTGSHPAKAFDWWMENSAAFLCLGLLIATYRRLPLSDWTYLLIAVYLCLHEWGAQSKYGYVPLGEWMKAWLDTTRNHYDRLTHFSYGFLTAYPLQEWCMRIAGVWTSWRYALPVALVLALSALYEILEAWVASILSPARAEVFVGMQGDVWDAQKDMALAAAGAVLQMAIVALVRYRRHQAAAQAESASLYAGAPLSRR